MTPVSHTHTKFYPPKQNALKKTGNPPLIDNTYLFLTPNAIPNNIGD